MAYTRGFTYDIFISYAHVDNTRTGWEDMGWVEEFCKNLKILLDRIIGKPDVIKIWWDQKRLDGDIYFDDHIQKSIAESAIILCLTSHGYLASDYCKKELQLFYNKAKQETFGLKISDRSRLLNALLYNIPYTQWPRELSGTTGFPFHNAKEEDEDGVPFDKSDLNYRDRLQKLSKVIKKLLDDFPPLPPGPPPPGTEPPPPPEPPSPIRPQPLWGGNGFSIYIGAVADSLQTTRKRTMAELEKRGYKVVNGIPPPYGKDAHEQKVKEELQKTNLAVHLLDQYPGIEIEGSSNIWYPQRQAELGLQLARSQLIWVPAEIDLNSIEEENYQLFLKNLEKGGGTDKNYEFIRGAKSTLTQQIADFAEQTKIQQKQKPIAKGKIAVLLDTHFNDQLYAMDLSKALLENEIQPFINPQEDDPRKNMNMLEDRIRQVNKFVFFYGKVSKDWVLERMNAVLQLVITNNYPVDDFYVYLAPPHKDPNDVLLKQKFLKINVIDGSDNTSINKVALQRFLENLKGQAA